MELKYYFRLFQKKLWLIVLIVMIACAATGIRSYYMVTPVYTAAVKLIVNQPSKSSKMGTDIKKIQTDMMLIHSYKEIIHSPAILNKVVEQYPGLHASTRELSRVSVAAADNSLLMSLMYTDTSYERAVNNVNAISNVFKQQIPKIMNIDNVTILAEANLNGSHVPINSNPQMDILISLFISLMFAAGLVFFLDYMDKTYKSEADLEADLGLPVLVSVMKMKKQRRKRKRPYAASDSKAGGEQYATVSQ
ncbi:YveK family protein [Paenibacillus solisilvae]|uniref:YveK family protein n=1 Tax=Paenibacillus solisilvae TaxID=2486751 RepID=A0ABW0VU20_9BACL